MVGIATGWALARGEPALAILHTTAGLGNAVGAIATARVNRAPLVIVVGQQDRRHLAHEPFLAGKLLGLAGEYPVWVDQPVRPQDVPGAVARAYNEALTAQGPALVIVPMDDWDVEAEPAGQLAAATHVVRSRAVDSDSVAQLAAFLARAERPALVVGAGADEPATWVALVALAERLGCAVWQESFSARAGFPQDHRLFAGHLPADRIRLRETLSPYDAVLAVGAPVFRQYPYIPGPFVEAGTRVAMVSQYEAEVHRSVVELAVLADPGAVCAELARIVPARSPEPPVPFGAPRPRASCCRRAATRRSRLAALADRLPRNAIVIEESPSSRPELIARLPARESGGCAQSRNGWSRFRDPGRDGMRLAQTERPVVAIVGDGSSLYGCQALWSAATYGAGVLLVILANGGYAIMDRLAEQHGGAPPWPSFEVDIVGLATAFGCPARRITGHEELIEVFDEVIPGLAARSEPLLLEVAVRQTRCLPRERRREMKAAVMRAYHQPLEFDERPVPEPVAPSDVLIRIGGAGVCATDLHALEGLMEPAGVTLPLVLGHENAGWVEEVGSG